MGGGPARREVLSRADSARWHMSTPENPMVIGALLVLERRLTSEAVEELVRVKLLPHRRFRQHVVESRHWFGRPRWCDDADFDLLDHVRAAELPCAGDALARVVGDRMSALLPRDRSPWTIDLVHLAHGGSALLFRVHHCIADGQALVTLLSELSDEGAPDPVAVPARGPSPAGPGRSQEGSWVSKSLGALAALFRFLTLSRDTKSALLRPLAGEKRVAWSEAIPLDRVKALARAGDCHVAAVLLAAVAGALERYVRDHAGAPRALRALLPVAMPSSEDGEAGLGNHYASVLVGLPIAGTAPQARLKIIADELAGLGARGESRVAGGLIGLAGAVAPGIEHWAVRRWSRRASLVVSSVAGPLVPLHVAGLPLKTTIVWAPAPACVALSLTVFGYAGALHVGALSDAAVIDQPEELIAAFHEALDDLGRGVSLNAGQA